MKVSRTVISIAFDIVKFIINLNIFKSKCMIKSFLKLKITNWIISFWEVFGLLIVSFASSVSRSERIWQLQNWWNSRNLYVRIFISLSICCVVCFNIPFSFAFFPRWVCQFSWNNSVYFCEILGISGFGVSDTVSSLLHFRITYIDCFFLH